MTMHRTLPSEIEAEALAELIADCRRIPTTVVPPPRHDSVDLTVVAEPRREIRIPDTTASLLDGYADYGS